MAKIDDTTVVNGKEYRLNIGETELSVRIRDALARANPVPRDVQEKFIRAISNKKTSVEQVMEDVAHGDLTFFEDAGIDQSVFEGNTDMDYIDKVRLIGKFYHIPQSEAADLGMVVFDALWNKIMGEYVRVNIVITEVMKENNTEEIPEHVVHTENLD